MKITKPTVKRDPITGRFVSIKGDKAVHSKAIAPKEKKVKETIDKDIVSILSAAYGIDGNRIEITAIPGKKLNNKMAGADPAPKMKKDAIIIAMVNGEEVKKTFSEGEVISF
jgi:hypothetical protein